jgi:hypothetical protein
MNGLYNPSQVIVGFRDWYLLDNYGNHNFKSPEAMAESALSRAPGFILILHRFIDLNAVLVKVDPGLTDQFKQRAAFLDEVEYCEYDYFLEICAFTDSFNTAHQKGITQTDAFAPHLVRTSRSAPFFGASVALIDTGISPHPFLPALSLKQALGSPLSRHRSFQNRKLESLIYNLSNLEDNYSNAYIYRSERSALNGSIEYEIQKYLDTEWNIWTQNIHTWIGQAVKSPHPPMPLARSLFGALRVISPHSWNFVEDNPNVLDYDGHGTGTAGCIAAFSPLSYGILPEISPVLTKNKSLSSLFDIRSIAHLDYDVTGFSPYAELIVLKCLNTRKADSGTMSTLIDALGYCLKIKPDCIYFGIALKNIQQAPLLTLSRRTAQLEKAGITMFAPAGNDGAAGVRAPAASPGVLPVTAVEWNRNNTYSRAPYSSYADVSNNEGVEFCACGGTDKSKIQLLSTDFGFTYDYGTSVSAAVVTSLFLNELCIQYKQSTEMVFRNKLSAPNPNWASDIRKSVESWNFGPNDIAQAKSELLRKAIAVPGSIGGNSPHPEFGYGLPRI